MRFRDKVVWVTGASRGIGAALARALDSEGAKLILSARDGKKLAGIAAGFNEARILPLDISDPASIQSAAQEALSYYGRIDILVNNAGVSQRGVATENSNLEVLRTIMETNFFGAVALTKAVLPSMLAKQCGQIVVTSSVLGKFGAPRRSAYCASKFALHGYFEALRAELHRQNIKVTIVCPGFVLTEVSKHALEADGSAHGVIDPGQARGMNPDRFAKKMLSAIAKEKEEVFIGGLEAWAVHAKRLFPGIFSRIIRSIKMD